MEYLVKWKGYESSENTWEPKENLEEARKVLKEFESKRKGEDSTDVEAGDGKKRKRLYTATDFPMRFAKKYPDPDPCPAPQVPQIPEESESSEEEQAYSVHRKAKAEDLEVLSVRVARGNQLMWTVLEGTGKKREIPLEQVKKRAPLALVDYLISKLRFA
jgi:hypothetical protein